MAAHPTKWTLEVWATGPNGQAAKVLALFDTEPSPAMVSRMKNSSTLAYKTAYADYPQRTGAGDMYGSKLTPPASQAATGS